MMRAETMNGSESGVTVTVSILGESFRIRGGSQEEVEGLARYVEEKIEEIRKWARNNIKGVGSRIENNSIAGNRTDRIYEL